MRINKVIKKEIEEEVLDKLLCDFCKKEIEDPEFVNIGADSKNHNLPEPSAFKIENLIKGLQKFTKSISKENLFRIKK